MKNILSRIVAYMFVLFIWSTGISICQAAFTDIPDDYEYKEAVEYAETNKIVSGFSDKTFQPYNQISRGEFTKILLSSKYGVEEINGCTSQYFSDVPLTHTFFRHICFAKRNNIASGFSDGTYKPSNIISFAEASKLVSNTLLGVSNVPTIAWQAYVESLQQKNAIPITIGRLQQPLTRGEMVEIIYRLKTNNTSKQTRTFEVLKNNHISPRNVYSSKTGSNTYDGLYDLYSVLDDGTGKIRLIKNFKYVDFVNAKSNSVVFLGSEDGQTNNIIMMDVDGSNRRIIKSNAVFSEDIWSGRHFNIDLSPDGRKLLYQTGDANSISIVNFDNAKSFDLSRYDKFTWSPDSKNIFFSEKEFNTIQNVSSAKMSHYLMNVESQVVNKFEECDSNSYIPRIWAPNSSKLVVVCSGKLNQVTVENQKITTIIESQNGLSTGKILSYSPDSSRLFFVLDVTDPFTKFYIYEENQLRESNILVPSNDEQIVESWLGNYKILSIMNLTSGNASGNRYLDVIDLLDSNNSDAKVFSDIFDENGNYNYSSVIVTSDYSKIIFASMTENAPGIFSVGSDGTNLTKLYGNSGTYGLSLSKDETKVLFEDAASDSFPTDVFIVDTSSRQVKNISNSTGYWDYWVRNENDF